MADTNRKTKKTQKKKNELLIFHFFRWFSLHLITVTLRRKTLPQHPFKKLYIFIIFPLPLTDRRREAACHRLASRYPAARPSLRPSFPLLFYFLLFSFGFWLLIVRARRSAAAWRGCRAFSDPGSNRNDGPITNEWGIYSRTEKTKTRFKKQKKKQNEIDFAW